MLDNATLEKHLTKTTIVSNVISIGLATVTAVSIGLGFYYKTNDTMETHTQKIEKIEISVEQLSQALNNAAITQGASKEQIKALQDKMADVKKTQDRIEDKIDKLIMREVK